VKRQHYVWRHYFDAWIPNKDDKRVWSVIKGVSMPPSLIAPKDLAVDKGTYKMYCITEQDLLAYQSLNLPLLPDIRAILERFIQMYYTYSQVLNNGSHHLLKQQDPMSVIKDVEYNTFERWQSKIECFGLPLLKCKNASDLHNLYRCDCLSSVLTFICVQYWRTNKRRDEYMSCNQKLADSLFKIWPALSYAYAQQTAVNIVNSRKGQFYMLHNNTDVHFITSDQPVMYAESFDSNQTLSDFLLYYPLNPHLAILVEANSKNGVSFSDIEAPIEMIRRYNKAVLKLADHCVVSDSKEILLSLFD